MLKKIKASLRKLRAKWHGDLYSRLQHRSDMCRYVSPPLNLSLKPSEVDIISILAEWHRANLRNQISLANTKPGRRTIYTPWEQRAGFFLDMTKSGQLCIRNNVVHANARHSIFAVTMPKSGTYFLGAILESLGFKNPEVHGIDRTYSDGRRLPQDAALSDLDAAIHLPFAVQRNLILPNQFLLTHLIDPQPIKHVLFDKIDRVLVVVRDLRYCFISFTRHMMEGSKPFSYVPIADCTSHDVYKGLGAHGDVLLGNAKCCLDLMQTTGVNLVRYEELMASDKNEMLPSVKAISMATDCQLDEVFKAVAEKKDTITPTFTDDHVTLDRLWTKQVEDLFIAKGGDILNEKLGYNRVHKF